MPHYGDDVGFCGGGGSLGALTADDDYDDDGGGGGLDDEVDVGKHENITVVVRVRPLLRFEEERGGGASVVSLEPADGRSLTVNGHEPRHKLRVTFDAALGASSTQTEVYSHIKDCAAAVVEGFNATVFAYGQTGTGKSHTMFGPPGHVQSLASGSGRLSAQAGVVPRAIVDVFDHLKALTQESPGHAGHRATSRAGGAGSGAAANNGGVTVQVFCSFVQIYNEQVFDMLRDPSRGKPLEVKIF